MGLRYPGVVFDFDGTLADSLDPIALGLKLAFEEAGLPAPGRAEVARTIGVPLREIIESLLPPELRQPALVTQLVERYRTIQRPLLPGMLRLFPGTIELLDALRQAGVRLAVASNKMREDLDAHLALLQISRYFELVDGGDDHPPDQRKPHPAPLHGLEPLLGLPRGGLLMIGDTVYDLQMARAAGWHCVAVTYGCHERDLLLTERPTYLVDRPGQILDVVCGEPGAGVALP